MKRNGEEVASFMGKRRKGEKKDEVGTARKKVERSKRKREGRRGGEGWDQGERERE